MSSAPRGVASFNSRCRRSASQAPPVRMPTRPVESLTLERSFPRSSWHKVSASGRFIEIALKNDFCSERVDVLLVLATAATGFPQGLLGRHRRQALVGKAHGKAETRLELPREAPRTLRHGVLAAVHRQRQAHEKAFGPPFADQRLDLGDAPRGACGFEHPQRGGDSRFGVADRDADPASAEIKSEYGVAGDLRRSHGRLTHACPASSESLAKSTPSSFIAAGKRPSAGVSKMIASFASTVSHAFCLISFSSCPAAQPE